MKKTDIIKDKWGEPIIRVFKCQNFQKVPQDISINMIKRLHKKGNEKNQRICDIILKVEDYSKK